MTSLPAWNGELVVTLGGVERTMRPAFSAVPVIERLGGASILAMAGEVEAASPRITTVVAVVTACVNAGGGRSPATGVAYTFDEVGALVMGPDLVAWVEIAAALLAHYLTGGTAGKAALGEASTAVRKAILKQIDGSPVGRPLTSTGPDTSPPPSASSG